MKFHTMDVVFSELPDEISLVFSITGCTNNCRGCHSPHLQEDIGTELTPTVIDELMNKYSDYITAVCFLGGDKSTDVNNTLSYIKEHYKHLKIGLYSGNSSVSNMTKDLLDYVKVGCYIDELGGLDKKTTNQRMFKKIDDEWIDITSRFW